MGERIERLVSMFSPDRAMKMASVRVQTKAAEEYLAKAGGGYYRKGRGERQLASWLTDDSDANAALQGGTLQQLRNDSNDLYQNNTVAAGAVNTKVTNIIGPGLRLNAQIDADALGMTFEQAKEWEANTEKEWKIFSKTCDITREMSFEEQQALVLRSTLINGDHFINLPVINRRNQGVIYQTSTNHIEAHRISNPSGMSDSDSLIMGVALNKLGQHTTYHAASKHPGSFMGGNTAQTWAPLKVWNRSGSRNVLHVYKKLRANQVRGVPDLAPIIEILKNLDTFTQAEIHNAVVSSFFSVFITTETEGNPLNMPSEDSPDSTKDLALGPGAIFKLQDNEKVEFADPSRPNANFDMFFKAVVTQIGMALEIPFEVLMKQFQSSYSASKGALMEAWKMFFASRTWMAESFCQPVYERFLLEAVALGRIQAPGFNDDPLIRMAWCGSQWVGPPAGDLDPQKAVKAAKERIELGISNEFIETSERGLDFSQVLKGRVQAHKMKEEAGLLPEIGQNEENSSNNGENGENNDVED